MIAEALAAVALAPPVVALDAAAARPGDVVAARVASSRPVRLYLVPAGARGVRSRFDARLHFAGQGRSPISFVVPPLDGGTYHVAVWCARCRPALAVRRTARLRIATSWKECPATLPNAAAPSGVPEPDRFHGNGLLAALVPATGVCTAPRANEELFVKMLWVAPRTTAELRVAYQRVGVADELRRAVAIPGRLGVFDGPSWASRLYLREGCWRIRGRHGDVSLSFVVKVAAP